MLRKSASSSGVRVAQMVGSDRPNNIERFNIALSGVIAVIKWDRRLLNHALGRDVEFYA